MINQCSSCGGFCKKSGCERENVKPTPQRTWVGLTDDEMYRYCPIWLCQADFKALMLHIEAKLKEKNH